MSCLKINENNIPYYLVVWDIMFIFVKTNTKIMYIIEIEVRDSNGKIIFDERGFKFTSLQIDSSVTNESLLERQMVHICETLKVWMPQNKIDIQASVLNSISGTWMCMYSYYGSEKRFIKH